MGNTTSSIAAETTVPSGSSTSGKKAKALPKTTAAATKTKVEKKKAVKKTTNSSNKKPKATDSSHKKSRKISAPTQPIAPLQTRSTAKKASVASMDAKTPTRTEPQRVIPANEEDECGWLVHRIIDSRQDPVTGEWEARIAWRTSYAKVKTCRYPKQAEEECIRIDKKKKRIATQYGVPVSDIVADRNGRLYPVSLPLTSTRPSVRPTREGHAQRQSAELSKGPEALNPGPSVLNNAPSPKAPSARPSASTALSPSGVHRLPPKPKQATTNEPVTPTKPRRVRKRGVQAWNRILQKTTSPVHRAKIESILAEIELNAADTLMAISGEATH
ncbi:hypothetical protein V8E36_004828 [Tilletia maclaganii]